jgi:hypothetical protein
MNCRPLIAPVGLSLPLRRIGVFGQCSRHATRHKQEHYASIKYEYSLIASVFMPPLSRFSSHRHKYIHLQLPFVTPCIQSFRLPILILWAKVNTDTIHTMPLILGIPKALALENMSQMSAAVIAHNLRPHHAHSGIGALANSAWHRVPERWPPAA